ncbi:MAG: protoheme IX farnesyltransferase [Verrucomicrobia bacterium]|nr:protoheme IX farnesyltransferase [Verrucomicrobiota bacterium]
MSTVSPEGSVRALPRSERRNSALTWVSDINVLVKARLTLLVLITTLVGFLFACGPEVDGLLLFNTLLGTFLAAAGAAALNQVFEADYDGLMRRTRNRPIPAQRISRDHGFAIGLGCSAVGVIYLSLTTNFLTALLTAITIGTYVFAYTPLKRITTLNTIVGAVPGALPPVIGWAAVRGEVNFESWLLFAILFLWQMPHFLAIAWLYRKDYRDAGFVMLSGNDTECRVTGRLALFYTVALVSISLLPYVLRLTSPWYVLIAFATGFGFFIAALTLALTGTDKAARRLFLVSIVYLPITLGALVITRTP